MADVLVRKEANMTIRFVTRRRGVFIRALAWTLVGSLALGATPTVAVASASPAATSSTLSVASDPVAASVYVDGQLRGATPVSLDRLTPGDHRLRLVKDGYLENSRVVHIGAGQAGSVSVRLTPGPRTDAIRKQVEGTEEVITEQKGGGRGKWLLIGGGVLAAGVATVLLLPKNDPPSAGTIGVSPDGVGVMAATRFSFQSNASDPNKDSLTYSWNFGDGASGSGQTATHTYASDGTFTVSLSVSDGKESATAPPVTVQVRSLSASWAVSSNQWVGTIPFQVAQSGSAIDGSSANGNRFTGTVSDPRNVSFDMRWAGCPTLSQTFTGAVASDGASFAVSGCGCSCLYTYNLTFRR
jgi:hypothetical protein